MLGYKSLLFLGLCVCCNASEVASFNDKIEYSIVTERIRIGGTREIIVIKRVPVKRTVTIVRVDSVDSSIKPQVIEYELPVKSLPVEIVKDRDVPKSKEVSKVISTEKLKVLEKVLEQPKDKQTESLEKFIDIEETLGIDESKTFSEFDLK